MTLETLQQQMLQLSSSGDILNGNLYNNNLPPSDAISQLLRSSSQDFLLNDNNILSQYQLGELFHNSQVFKGLPEGIYSYLNSSSGKILDDNTDRGVPPSPSYTENNNNNNNNNNNKFLRWMNTFNNMDSHRHKLSTSGDQIISPFSFSPTGDIMTGTTTNSNIGARLVPDNVSACNYQDDSEDGEYKSGSESSRKRDGRKNSGAARVIDGERAVKKKRRQEKNREAAQLFRQRQKAKVHELEQSVDELTYNNNDYRMKMEILVFENKILKDQLMYLKNLVSSGILVTSVPPIPSSFSVPDRSDVTSLLMAGRGGGMSIPNHLPSRIFTEISNVNNSTGCDNGKIISSKNSFGPNDTKQAISPAE